MENTEGILDPVRICCVHSEYIQLLRVFYSENTLVCNLLLVRTGVF